MTGASRVDVYLESFETAAPEQLDGANSLKVGDKLWLQKPPPTDAQSTCEHEGLLFVVNNEGGHVGHIRESFLQGKIFSSPPFLAAVRSIKRDKETTKVVQVFAYCNRQELIPRRQSLAESAIQNY
jgi:hypothetical protein